MEVAASCPLKAQMHQNGATPPLPPRLVVHEPVAPCGSEEASLRSVTTTMPGVMPGVSKQAYPAALAHHSAVVASKELFLDTLNKFHLALGTRLVIPKMGGKDLDLHVLYVEVTQRGGLQQVIKDRKWKEITGAFNFPRTTTSASYVLRKYYITLLHHYEQLYYFGSTGLLVSPPTPLAAPSPGPVKQIEYAPAPEAHAEEPEVINAEGKKIRKRRLAPMPLMTPVDPTASVGNVVSGAIEGKFEQGYLVTVVVGMEKLRGVIYHVPPGHAYSGQAQYAHIPSFMLSQARVVDTVSKRPDTTTTTTMAVPAKDSKRKQREELKKDPNAPRSSRTGYNFFFAEERAKLKLLYPDKERELSRMIGDAWNALTEEQKMPYQERGAKDKMRYEKEMRDYRQSKSFQATSNPPPTNTTTTTTTAATTTAATTTTATAATTTATLQELGRPEAAEKAGDGDYHVEPGIECQIHLNSHQELVSSSQCEQDSTLQDPTRHFLSSTPSQPEEVGSEGNRAGSSTQPVAHQ